MEQYTTVNGGGALTNYLGGFGNEIGTTQVYKDFTLSGNQTSATISFDFYEMDSWDGESFRVWIDGVQYTSNAFYNEPAYPGRELEPTFSQQVLSGYSNLGGAGYGDEIHRYTFTVNTTSTNIRLGFSSTLDQTISDESWGIDNLSIVEYRPNLAIAENSANSTVVGTVQGFDVDAGTTLSYSIQTQSYAGAFAINSSTGQITVADSSLLNYETAASHNVTVRVSDGSLTFDKVVAINLTNVNEAPTAVLNSDTAVEAGGVANGTAVPIRRVTSSPTIPMWMRVIHKRLLAWLRGHRLAPQAQLPLP